MKPLEKLRFIREENGSINLMSGRYDEFGEPVSEARVLARATALELHRQLSELLGISSPAPEPQPMQDNQGEKGWLQVGWYWVEGVSTDEYSCKFQGFRPDETYWFVAHKWAPMFINTLAPAASAGLVTVVEQAFIDHGAPHDYRLIVEIARRIAGTSAMGQAQREASLAGAKTREEDKAIPNNRQEEISWEPKLELQPPKEEPVLLRHRVASMLGHVFAWLRIYNTWPVIFLIDSIDGRPWRTGAPRAGYVRIQKPRPAGPNSPKSPPTTTKPE